MSFEDERLRILQRVSNGELTPQEGQLEIAMLKVQQQQGHDEPGLQGAEPAQQREQPFAQMPPFARLLQLSWPVGLALVIPFVLIGGVLLVGLGLFLAFPTYLAIAFYNNAAAANPGWPMLAFWPTLAAVMLAVSIVTVLNWGRRIRTLIRTQSETRPFGE